MESDQWPPDVAASCRWRARRCARCDVRAPGWPGREHQRDRDSGRV